LTSQSLREKNKALQDALDSVTKENLHLMEKVEILQKRLDTFGSVVDTLNEIKSQRELLDLEVQRITRGRSIGLP